MGWRAAIAAGRTRAARLWRGRDGVAVVEFAIILPLGLVLLMALIDFTRAFNERKRIALVSSTIAEMVSEQSTTDSLTVAKLDAILTGASAIMTPYPSNSLAIAVSAIQLTAKSDGSCCQAKVQWSVARGGTLRPCNTVLAQVPSTTAPAPNNMLAAMVDSSMLGGAASVQLIVADIKDPYQSLFSELAAFFGGLPQRTSYRALRAWGTLALQSGSSTVSGEQSKVCF